MDFDTSKFDIPQEVAQAYLESLRLHIQYVREAGQWLKVPAEQLEHHDDSKFSPEEFPYYAMHFHGGGDPEGFASAWLHHIHHNPHHWQYWKFPDGFSPEDSGVEDGLVRMPDNYVLEMLADWMGASRAYTGAWDMTDWLQENMRRIWVHSATADLLRHLLDLFGYGDVINTHYFAHEMGMVT